MATLKARLATLEATRAPASGMNYCTVLHKGDCEANRAEAIAKYVESYGVAPTKFLEVRFAPSNPAEGSTCSCPSTITHEQAYLRMIGK